MRPRSAPPPGRRGIRNAALLRQRGRTHRRRLRRAHGRRRPRRRDRVGARAAGQRDARRRRPRRRRRARRWLRLRPARDIVDRRRERRRDLDRLRWRLRDRGRRRRRRRRRRRHRLRWRRRHGGGRLHRRSRRQESERVEVPLLLARDADPEMQMWRRRVGLDARPDAPDRVALGDHPAPFDEQRAELGQRDRIAVRGANRHDEAVAGHRAGERDLAGGRCDHRSAELGGDVDASVLAAGVRVRAEPEGAQHVPVGRPRPGGGRSRDDKARGEQQRRDTDAGQPNAPLSLCCRVWRHDQRGGICASLSNLPTATIDRGGCAAHP